MKIENVAVAPLRRVEWGEEERVKIEKEATMIARNIPAGGGSSYFFREYPTIWQILFGKPTQ